MVFRAFPRTSRPRLLPAFLDFPGFSFGFPRISKSRGTPRLLDFPRLRVLPGFPGLSPRLSKPRSAPRVPGVSRGSQAPCQGN